MPTEQQLKPCFLKCKVDDCTAKSKYRGFCTTHLSSLSKLARDGKLTRGEVEKLKEPKHRTRANTKELKFLSWARTKLSGGVV